MGEGFRGTPDEAATISAELGTALGQVRGDLGRPLTQDETFAAMAGIAGTRCWDAMPVCASVGVVRLMWRGAGVASSDARYLLVTPDGHCFVEGHVPSDRVSAAEYLAIRQRFLIAHPPVDRPLPGSPEAVAAKEAYQALVDRVADAIAKLTAEAGGDTTTIH
ncbi:hypothetical protein [Azospirillum canadense]|uniref:hypothetical protein n=1 Tax=Azospirillum canadense TaxID=403962 RepID=UPI002226ADCC|nr:hypothetical protein [Azospirillum canadense]MCW2240765.1 hypothetical protein [Azospirillum canadense]